MSRFGTMFSELKEEFENQLINMPLSIYEDKIQMYIAHLFEKAITYLKDYLTRTVKYYCPIYLK